MNGSSRNSAGLTDSRCASAMIGGDGEGEQFAPERQRAEIAVRRRQRGEGEIDLAVLQLPQQRDRRRLVQFEGDTDVAGVVRDEERRQHRGAEGGQRAEPEAAAFEVRQFRQLALRLRRAGEQRAGVGKQMVARLGERHLPARPLEERIADLLLQFADLLAERRLRDMQRLRRPREMLMIRDSDEIREVTQFHPRTSR